jgi:hypothetical protein
MNALLGVAQDAAVGGLLATCAASGGLAALCSYSRNWGAMAGWGAVSAVTGIACVAVAVAGAR